MGKRLYVIVAGILLSFISLAQSYTLTDNDVVVTNGVIESCSYDFSIKDIIIPQTLDGQTVTVIGNDYVFASQGITSVTLPATLDTIGIDAFVENDLTNVLIPSSVIAIGSQAFAENFHLSSVSFPASLLHIGEWAFSGTALASISLPASITYIGDGAFQASFLTSVTIPASVTYIGEAAFAENRLMSVTFESNSNIRVIGLWAFADNVRLSSITLPTIATPGYNIYRDGYGSIYNPGDNISDFEVNYFIDDLTYTLTDDDVVVTDGVIESCSYDFAITNIIIPETLDGQSVIAIGPVPFINKDITSINLPSTLESLENSSFAYNSLASVTIPASVIHIGEGAFYYNSTLTSVIFEENSNIGNIRDGAFSANIGLSSITLPTNVTPGFTHYTDGSGNTYTPGDIINDFSTNYFLDIPYTLTDYDVVVVNGVIESCSYSLTYSNIIIPEILDGQTVRGIGDDHKYLFYDKGITTITLPLTIDSIGVVAFGNNSLTSVIIPASVTFLGYGAFSYNSLTNVSFEENSRIIDIGENAFNYNSSLSSITLPTNINPGFTHYSDGNGNTYTPGDNISDFATFYYADFPPYTLTDDDVIVTDGVIESCSYDFAFSNIIIPQTLDGQTVTAIGDDYENLFRDKDIATILLPATLESIGNFAFYGNSLISVTIPASVTNIGDYAFFDNSLTSLTIPASVTYLGSNAFGSNTLTSVSFEENSNIRNIGDDAFRYNFSLSTITLPANANPGFIHYTDGNGNTYVPGDNISDFYTNYYIDISYYTLTDDDVVVTDGVIESCSYDFAIKNIIIPHTLDGQTVTEIGSDYANLFRDKGITTVTLPSTLEHIGYMAFHSNSLKSVTIPSSVTNIGTYAFDFNSLTSVIIPASVNYIGAGVFRYNSLTSVTFEENSNISRIANSAFAYNSGLEIISLPTNTLDGFTHYKDGHGNTFVPGDNISDFSTNYYVDFPPYTLTDDDVVVTDGEIESCSYDFAISNIIIPQSLDGQTVIAIGDNVFSSKYITSVILPETVESFGWMAFASNYLTSISLPVSVTDIGRYAFQGNSLSSITIPTFATYIGQDAFSGNLLTSYLLPGSGEGYISSTWMDTYGNTFSGGYEVTDLRQFYARQNVELTNYTIAYRLDGGINPLSNPATYTIETASIILADATKDGYTFEGWYADAGFISQISEIPAGSIGDMELFASFTAIDYTITYYLNGGINAASNPATYTIEDAAIILADATKYGYTFDGWYSDAGFTTRVTEIPSGSSGDIELFASFTAIDYTITYNLDGGSNASSNPAIHTIEDATIILADATKDGYTFDGWYSDVGFTSQVTEIPASSTGDIELFASFVVIDYTITYDLDGGNNASSNPSTYTIEDAAIILADAAKDGYTFGGWYSDAGNTSQVTEIPAGSTGDVELFASFVVIDYTITYNLDGGINAVSNPETYAIEDASIILADAIKDGYTFDGWYSDAGHTSQVTEITQGSTGDIELYASFTVIGYTITYNLDGGSNAVSNPATYTIEDADIILADAAKEGYTFDGWYSDAGFTTRVTEIPNGSTGDLELWASYSVNIGISNSKDFGFHIYPNPAKNYIIIDRKDLKTESVEIIDFMGKLMKQITIESKKAMVDVSDLTSGTYLIRIDNEVVMFLKE